MADFDTFEVLTLRSHCAVRFCISFQVVSFDGTSCMFSRSTELVPGETMTISIPKYFLESHA